MYTPASLRLGTWLAWLSLLVLAAAPRLLSLDGFITADEVRWTCRTLNFRSALASGDWASTFQTGHPGVVTMALGSLALPARPDPAVMSACAELNPGQIAEFESWPVRSELRDLLYAARLPVALALALGVLAVYFLARRIFQPAIAWLGAALIALDPAVLAYSRVLHLDALLATLMTVSLLALLVSLRGSDWLSEPPDVSIRREQGVRGALLDGWLVLSGICAGLAVLAKAPGMFLGPFAAGLILLSAVRQPAATRSWRMAAVRLVAWGTAAGLAVFVAWPAMWVDPVGTLSGLVGKSLGYAVEAEKSTSFFLGRMVDDPGPIFYPVLLVLRASPVMLAGLAAALLLLRASSDRRAAVLLVAYAALFGAFMTLGEKKFDRYLLPAFPALDLVAAAGLVWLAERAGQRLPRVTNLLPAVVLGAAAVQALLAVVYFPHFLSYYNPLAGGSATALRATLVGWGEGLEEAADYLNGQPGAASLRAMGWGAAMGPLFAGQTLRTNDTSQALADSIVVYVSDVQTGKPLVETLRDRQPEHVVALHGIEYARVYANPWRVARPEPGSLANRVDLPGWDVQIGDAPNCRLRLLDARPRTSPAPAADTCRLEVTLYWQVRQPLDASYTVFTHLVNAGGEMLGQHDGLPSGGQEPTTRWRPGEAVADMHAIALRPDLPPGDYWLEVGLYRAETGERLGDALRLGPVRLAAR